MRMKPLGTVALVLAALSIGSGSVAQAQNAEELAEQQMQVLQQYMESAGMSPEQMKQAEAMLKGAAQPVAQQEAAEKARFDAQTAGSGQASVSILDKIVVMQVTKCERVGQDGNFIIEAQEGSERRKGWLSVGGDSHYDRAKVTILTSGVGLYEALISPLPDFDGTQLELTGRADGDRGPAELSVSVKCAGL
ncbi:MAG: hypothetical protein HKN55_01630 [Woeseiaceae bacterium]|nr:hypothetical protein [Woeseiaceae bacterium]